MDTQISLPTLMTIRLKDRVDANAVARATGRPAEEAAAELEAGARSGTLLAANGRYRVTAEGRELLAHLVEDERKAIDSARLDALYVSFDRHNSTLKQIVTDWQPGRTGHRTITATRPTTPRSWSASSPWTVSSRPGSTTSGMW